MAKFNLENLKEKATDFAQSSVAISYQTAEMAKLRLAIVAEEDAIKKAYQEMGKLYFKEHSEHPDPAYIPSCNRILEAQETIKNHEKRVQELRNPDILSPDNIPNDVVDISSEDAEQEVTADDLAD